mmetsp:Transcript_302/g.723  ORF Transcript_302/g.723 Transcript_302/m.723 type:complete len:95 (-) Transcript_302:157-441(-)
MSDHTPKSYFWSQFQSIDIAIRIACSRRFCNRVSIEDDRDICPGDDVSFARFSKKLIDSPTVTSLGPEESFKSVFITTLPFSPSFAARRLAAST